MRAPQSTRCVVTICYFMDREDSSSGTLAKAWGKRGPVTPPSAGVVTRSRPARLPTQDRPASARSTRCTSFFIPAHRTLVLADGYPLAFQQLTNEAPFIVRQFSEAVRQVLIRGGPSEVLFPPSGRLKGHIHTKIDDAIFHGVGRGH